MFIYLGVIIFPPSYIMLSGKIDTRYVNILLSGITRGVRMRLVMTCPALRQDIGSFEDLSVLTKICPCPTSRSHLFLRLFDKMYRACNADQS